MKRLAKRLVWLIAFGAGILLFARFVVTPFVVVGDSMTPTLRSWDLCLMRRVYHYQPRRGDIVVFRTADDPPLYFVKRVIALPGESLAIDDGVVCINGVPLKEPYTTVNPDWQMDPT
ncbi:MAG TPA: signal peptidase I, partial [Verrucomicrobiae bacterium]|nr:signal peptidase I [Verrucomicrobiae bacterium]